MWNMFKMKYVHSRSSGVFIANFEHISHLFLAFLLLNLNKLMLAGFFLCSRTVFAQQFLAPQAKHHLEPWYTAHSKLNPFSELTILTPWYVSGCMNVSFAKNCTYISTQPAITCSKLIIETLKAFLISIFVGKTTKHFCFSLCPCWLSFLSNHTMFS